MNETAYIWIAALWVAAVGGCVGSFLNVVIYRLPAGMSLSFPSSHCPRCRHPIRWHDNVPVFGWLLLGGHCRDCRTWIPVRYPAVEAAVAALFLLVVFVEGATLGGNLPPRPVSVVDGLIYPELTLWESAGIMGWHLFLLCSLLCASLIRYDGHDVPMRLFFPGLMVGVLGTWIWPHLLPQPAAILATGPTPGIIDCLAGLVMGVLLGLMAWKLLEPSRFPDLLSATVLTGTFLGWQPLLVVGTAVVVLAFLSKAIGSSWAAWGRVPPVAWLGLCSLVWIVRWRSLAELLFGVSQAGC